MAVGFDSFLQQAGELFVKFLHARQSVLRPEQTSHHQSHDDSHQGVDAAVEDVVPAERRIFMNAEEHHGHRHGRGYAACPSEPSQQWDGDQQAHEDARPAGHDRVHQEGHKSTGQGSENASARSSQTVLILVVDDEIDRQQRIPEIGDALKMLSDGTRDQDAYSEPDALSQQIPVNGCKRWRRHCGRHRL